MVRTGEIDPPNDADDLESLLPRGHTTSLNRHTAGIPLFVVQSLLRCTHVSPDMVFVDNTEVTLHLPSDEKGEVVLAELDAARLRDRVVIVFENHAAESIASDAEDRVQRLLF